MCVCVFYQAVVKEQDFALSWRKTQLEKAYWLRMNPELQASRIWKGPADDQTPNFFSPSWQNVRELAKSRRTGEKRDISHLKKIARDSFPESVSGFLSFRKIDEEAYVLPRISLAASTPASSTAEEANSFPAKRACLYRSKRQ